FFRSAYPVDYVPVKVAMRVGEGSHIRPLKDGVRFLLIIFKIATLYSPLKLFVPVSLAFFTTGLGYYAYTFATQGRFTNMSLLLLSAAVIVFLIGLISEQITNLTYLAAIHADSAPGPHDDRRLRAAALPARAGFDVSKVGRRYRTRIRTRTVPQARRQVQGNRPMSPCRRCAVLRAPRWR